MLTRFKIVIGLAALLAVVAFAAAACGDDDDDGSGASNATAQHADVVAALAIFEGAALHEVDDNLQKSSELPADLGVIEHLHQVASTTDWPDDLSEKAQTLVDSLEAFHMAIEDEDLQAAKTASGETHAAWHDFQGDAYAWVAGETTAPDGGQEAHHGSTE